MNRSRIAKVLCAVGAGLVGGQLVAATTFAELQSEIDAAEAGATVYVESDMEYDGPISVAKTITIASPEGTTNVITRAASYTDGQLLYLNTGGIVVTFQDVIVDGRKIEDGGKIRKCAKRFMQISAGTVQMERGAIFRNYYSNVNGTIQLTGYGYLTMQEGCEIREFENDMYGSAIQIGTGNVGPCLTMNGGLVTGCKEHYTSSNLSWGGTIYQYAGSFFAHGGRVTGNTSDRCIGGVNVYFGSIQIKGNFTVWGNRGALVDNFLYTYVKNYSMQATGDYTGRMSLRYREGTTAELETVAEGDSPDFIYTSQWQVSRKGWPNIVAEDDPTLGFDLSANMRGNYYPVWRRIAATATDADGAFAANALSYKEAVECAPDGGTVLLLTNMTMNAFPAVDGKSFTLTSAVGGPYTVLRTKTNQNFLRVTNGKVTLRDVIFDGGGDDVINTDNEKGAIVWAQANGCVELGSGTVLRGGRVPTSGAAAMVRGAGSKLVMRDGALITGCKSMNANGYGSAVMIGNGATGTAVSPGPRFEMEGGSITGCACDLTAGISVNGGYTGVVYVYAYSVFDMTGGAITNNTSANGCAGVVNYVGEIHVSGKAQIKDNAGPYSSVYNCSTRKAYYYGDFRGCVEMGNGSVDYTDDQEIGKSFKVMPLNGNATGAWCFRAARGKTANLVGKVVSGSVVWAEAVGSVGWQSAATADDLALAAVTPLDLSEGSFERSQLPLVFTGAALNLSGGTVALSYDPVALRTAHRRGLSIPLFAPAAGETLGGSWTFTLPTDEKYPDGWTVGTMADGSSWLAYYPPGALLLVR